MGQFLLAVSGLFMLMAESFDQYFSCLIGILFGLIIIVFGLTTGGD